MAGAANISNLSPILKTIWAKTDREDQQFENAPLYAMMPKDPSWDGLNRVIVMHYAGSNGIGANYATAYANRSATKTTKMTVETADIFGIWSVDHKLITLSRNDAGAVMRALESQTKAIFKGVKRRVAMGLHGNGGGAVGQLDSGVTLTSTTLTLRNIRTARNFQEGDWLTFSSDDGTGGAGEFSGRNQVVSVNRKTGVLTMATALSTAVPSITVNSYVFHEGDYNGWLKGLPYYVPVTDAAAASSIWGMSRTADLVRLAGIRVGGKGKPIADAIKGGLVRAYEEEASPSHIFLHPSRFNELDLALGTQRRYADVKIGNIGFTGIEFTFAGGKGAPVKIFADPDNNYDLIWGLNMDTWKLASAGNFPDFLNLDGSKVQPEEASNSFLGKIGGYIQAYTEAPGENFVVDMTVT